jgi:hypothetical protein
MKSTILFMHLLFCSMVMFGQETKETTQDLSVHYPLPAVDRRVELLSIVFRLAGNYEYNFDDYRSHVSDIHRHFDPYKGHPLIAFATKMRDKQGVSFDAVQAMAIHLEHPPALSPVVPFSSTVPERRWGKENALRFVELLKQFHKDARCEAFFAKHETLYQTAREQFHLSKIFAGLNIHLPDPVFNIRLVS